MRCPEAVCVCIHMHSISKAAQVNISTSQPTEYHLEDIFLKGSILEKQQGLCEGEHRRNDEI